MSATLDFTQAFAARSRRLAEAARRRVTEVSGASPEGAAPAWLRGVVQRLPERAQAVLRDALSPGGDPLIGLRHALERRLGQVRDRETALDQAGADLDRARRAIELRRAEIEARANAAERALAEARRLADEAGTERRVPIASIRFDPADSPRPIRGVARLAANIKRFGQLTPLVVRPTDDGLQLVCGYRRMAALQRAGFTHALVRVVPNLDEATAAALYVAENCLVDGVSSKAVQRLAEQLADAPGFADVLPLVLADDAAVVEDVFLEDMVQEAHQNLAEGAAWVAALRPYWAEIEGTDRAPLEALIGYFAKVAQRLR